MTDPLNPGHHAPLPDDDLTPPIEDRLRFVQPRAPQLDWDRLKQCLATKPVETTPAIAVALVPTSFTTWQLGSAIVVAWVFGVVVGGSAMNWSRSTSNSSSAASGASAPHTAESLSNKETGPAIASQTTSQQLDSRSAGIAAGFPDSPLLPEIDARSKVWNVEQPLSALSLTARERAHQLAVNRTRVSTKIPVTTTSDQALTIDLSSDQPANSSPASSSPNRRQLLRELTEENSDVY